MQCTDGEPQLETNVDLRAEAYPQDGVNNEQIHIASTRTIARLADHYCVTALLFSP